jgi:squalene-hopene/tetraprenyl-beta-curcumene cyclase
MIYAGVSADDPRVIAAKKWAQKNYTLDQNPGLGRAGLYYYYHTFAKALAAVGDDEFVDASGTRRNWRRDLVNALAERQQSDGSWVNEHTRWLEGDANLVTAYALLSLSYVPKQTDDESK